MHPDMKIFDNNRLAIWKSYAFNKREQQNIQFCN